MVDYPLAIPMFVDEQRTFIDALVGLTGDQLSLVVHKTGGTPNLASLANYFQTGASGASTHFGIDLDGTVGQFVPLKDGSGGNCCLEVGHDTYWDSFSATYGNLNRCTISIEHIDPTQDNSTQPPAAQINASFALVRWLVQKFGIPLDHIKTHASLDPVSRARCPGEYPMAGLYAFLRGGGSMTPMGWKDDGQTLTAPNGVPVVLGFRQYVLANNWHYDNYPLYAQQHVAMLEASNTALGEGDQQLFRYSMLGYNPIHGVIFEWTGQELAFVRGQLAAVYPAYKQLQADNATLTQQVATMQPELGKLKQEVTDLQAQLAQQPAGLDPAKVADRLTAFGLLGTQVEQLANQPL